MDFHTREEWLEAAAGQLTGLLPPGATLPRLKVSVGWPKGQGRAHIGQCWSNKASADGETYHIFVAPSIEEAREVLRVLLHELVHALVGTEAKHRGAFVKLARAIGFMRPWSQTPASEGLLEGLGGVAALLGAYPHVGLSAPLRVKQGTRMKLWECSHGVKVRRAGMLNARCLDCDTMFELVGGKRE